LHKALFLNNKVLTTAEF